MCIYIYIYIYTYICYRYIVFVFVWPTGEGTRLERQRQVLQVHRGCRLRCGGHAQRVCLNEPRDSYEELTKRAETRLAQNSSCCLKL